MSLASELICANESLGGLGVEVFVVNILYYTESRPLITASHLDRAQTNSSSAEAQLYSSTHDHQPKDLQRRTGLRRRELFDGAARTLEQSE